MSTETIEEAVHQAAGMMDVRLPGWYEQIDTRTLSINDADDCIGGQTGIDWEDLNDEWRCKHGDST